MCNGCAEEYEEYLSDIQHDDELLAGLNEEMCGSIEESWDE